MIFRRRTADLNPVENTAATALKRLIQANSAALLGVVRQELLSGMREPIQFERLRLLLSSFPDVTIVAADHEEAAAIHNACRARGVAGNSVDFLICAVSIRRSWPIFTLDRDFVGYASCVPIRRYAMDSP